MKIKSGQRRPLGDTGLEVPPIVFGTAALANVPQVIPEQRKLAICGEWFRHVHSPVFVAVAARDGEGIALVVLGRMLRRLDVTGNEVVISLSLDAGPLQSAGSQAGRDFVLQQWEEGGRLLGDEYRPRLASIRHAEDYLAEAESAGDRLARWKSVVDAYHAIAELKESDNVAGIGVVSKDWQVAKELVDAATPDCVTLTNCCTLMHHTDDVLAFMADLAERHVPIILSGVFNVGFLVGGSHIDGRLMNANDPMNQSLFAWRKSFAALCHGHGVTPAHACIQFALSAPGVFAVELNSSYPDRIAENIGSVATKVPAKFWASMKEEGLLNADFQLGS